MSFLDKLFIAMCFAGYHVSLLATEIHFLFVIPAIIFCGWAIAEMESRMPK